MNGYDARLLAPDRKIIYLDLDGCVTNFIDHAQKYLHLEDMNKYDFQNWIQSKRGIADTLPKDFWETMPFMPNGRDLYNFCESLAPVVICTSPGNNPVSSGAKHMWISKNLKTRGFIITGAKWALANKNTILIDDQSKNVDRFTDAGGSAFLYKDSLFNEAKQWIAKTLNQN